jgi:hypothetical protein
MARTAASLVTPESKSETTLRRKPGSSCPELLSGVSPLTDAHGRPTTSAEVEPRHERGHFQQLQA